MSKSTPINQLPQPHPTTDDFVYNDIEQEIQNSQGVPYSSGSVHVQQQSPQIYAVPPPQLQPTPYHAPPQHQYTGKYVSNMEIKLAIIVVILYIVLSNDTVIAFFEDKLPGQYVSLIVRAIVMAVLVVLTNKLV